MMSNRQSGSTEDVDDMPPAMKRVLHQHAKEICVHARPSTRRTAAHVSIKREANHFRAFLHYLQHTVSMFFFTILTSPQTVLADPVGATFAILVLPVIHISLLFVQLVFLLAGFLGGGKLGHWFSQEYGFGLSAVNMLDPSMFDDVTAMKIHAAARKGLTNAYGFPDISALPDPSESVTPARYFNLDIAKSLIILCALVYERDDHYVNMAGEAAKRDDVSESEKQSEVARLLLQSSRQITRQASKYGFHFSSVSDFVSIGGPFCGLFWPKDSNEKWIVIAFKGTSPTNFSEFMVDATIVHCNAHSFFGNGSLHQGFYSSLAPGPESDVDPYANILHSLKHVAKSLKGGGDEKVNLWITGHSLGAALASLLYARLLFSPKDLGPDLVLRQGYMFGTPRVADAQFISAFDFASSTPFGDTTQSLWRVVDRWDIVTHVPPGLADKEEARAALPPTSLLNYGHFGTAGIRLTGSPNDDGWELLPGSFRGGSTLEIVQSTSYSTEPASAHHPRPPKMMDVLGMEVDPIGLLRRATSLVGPGADHMPSNYYARLQQVKAGLVI